jgi:redox-sensitive bicupin YhaK (pirin superfamily)
MKNTIFHSAESRGNAQHGWLHSRHTFSFANYYNPERMHFGALRVLNDDIVAGGMGFGRHPHSNMEIISIPLYGDLEHQDSMGNKGIIKQGNVQVMSAGTGIEHSEYNANKDKEVKFLQIWLFPNKQNVTPRYDQITIKNQVNTLQQIISPHADDEEGTWIHQNAWFNIATFDKGIRKSYTLHDSNNNGVYIFNISGFIKVDGQELKSRDAIGLWDVQTLEIQALSEAQFLIIEVPMNI